MTETTVETAAPATPVAKLTPFQEWANDPAATTASSATEIDTAAETAPASEPEKPAAEKKGKGQGLKKRFSALTSQIRELQQQLAAGKSGGAAATETGVAPPAKAETAKPAETGKPVAANFDTYEEYVEALTDWKLEQKDAARKIAEAQTSQQQTVKAQVDAARARHEDYDQVVTDKVPVSQAMAEVMVASENGAEIAYYLGKNPNEAARIAKLTPAQAGAALAKIEASLETAPAGSTAETAKPKVSKAPAPPKVITGSGGNGDPEPDPKNFVAWEKWYNRQKKTQDE